MTRRVMTAFDLEGHVVTGDDVLRGDFHRLLAEGDANHLVERAEDEDDAGAGGVVSDAAEAEDDATFVLLQNFDGVDKVKNDDGDDDEDGEREHGVSLSRQALECAASVRL